jgi:hypothetical protein
VIAFSLIIFPLCVALRGQDKGSAPGEFPAKLLEGPENFELAVLLQGDVRGNVGPCG